MRRTVWDSNCVPEQGLSASCETSQKKLYAIKKEEGVEFVHGIGHRSSPIPKSIEQLEEYQEKLKEYTKKYISVGKEAAIPKQTTMQHL